MADGDEPAQRIASAPTETAADGVDHGFAQGEISKQRVGILRCDRLF